MPRSARHWSASIWPGLPWEVVDEDGAPLAPEDRPELMALRSGTPTFATVGLRGGGIERWVAVAAHPLQRSPDQRWVAATYKDVSERLRIEAALRQAEATDRAKSEFLSRMSHELRTPLNSVLGFAQLMRIDELHPNHQESVDQILKAGRHLLGLLDEVLDLERIQSGHLEVNLAPTSIATTLQEAVELVQPLAVASGIAIDLRLGRDGGALVLADAQRLRQVLINLLTNGVKFNRPARASHRLAPRRGRLARHPSHGHRRRHRAERRRPDLPSVRAPQRRPAWASTARVSASRSRGS